MRRMDERDLLHKEQIWRIGLTHIFASRGFDALDTSNKSGDTVHVTRRS